MDSSFNHNILWLPCSNFTNWKFHNRCHWTYFKICPTLLISHTHTKQILKLDEAWGICVVWKSLWKQRQVMGVCCAVKCVLKVHFIPACLRALEQLIEQRRRCTCVNACVWWFAYGRDTCTHTTAILTCAINLPSHQRLFGKECEAMSDVSQSFCLSGPDRLCKYNRQAGGISSPATSK